MIVLDEIHKFPGWRNLVKGFCDTEGDRTSFLVTGSARLDHYRKAAIRCRAGITTTGCTP